MRKFIWLPIVMMALSIGTVAVAEDAPAGTTVSPAAASDVVTPTQARLTSFGYTVDAPGVYGDRTRKAVRHWQRANGLSQTGELDEPTIKSLGVSGQAPVVSVATPPQVPNPPAAQWISGDCDSFKYLFDQYGLPWDYFRPVMKRESQCYPFVYNGRNKDRSYGLLQLNTKGKLWSELKWRCGLTTKEQLLDPGTNIACGAKLYQAYGKKPWRTR